MKRSKTYLGKSFFLRASQDKYTSDYSSRDMARECLAYHTKPNIVEIRNFFVTDIKKCFISKTLRFYILLFE